MKNNKQICPECKGTGRIPKMNFLCKTCNGTGEVPVEEKNCKTCDAKNCYDCYRNMDSQPPLTDNWNRKEPQPNSDCEEMVKNESMSEEEILRDIYEKTYGTQRYEKSALKTTYGSICLSAMKEFALQSKNKLLEELEKEFKTLSEKYPVSTPPIGMILSDVIEIINKYKTK